MPIRRRGKQKPTRPDRGREESRLLKVAGLFRNRRNWGGTVREEVRHDETGLVIPAGSRVLLYESDRGPEELEFSVYILPPRDEE